MPWNKNALAFTETLLRLLKCSDVLLKKADSYIYHYSTKVKENLKL